MLSDGRIVTRGLEKVACADCGIVRHAALLDQDELTRFFGKPYTLYAHPYGIPYELQRQQHYAKWLLALTEPRCEIHGNDVER
jgi:hypothetical protein